jgi:hypothetical protein
MKGGVETFDNDRICGTSVPNSVLPKGVEHVVQVGEGEVDPTSSGGQSKNGPVRYPVRI